ncbi:CerR family C-terminal domain-containing protein [Pseudomonas vanderleydeniana]|uniref:CerR family C-terminal domain-containing protein n=1 Tax=Pseudomonas vanderleydeniana TaxID=2745495 RepID=A0A9E6PQZ5_9PSED|nr:CerR family C-terminal domain-containing protein [Pseudomonas vanderleydeniana]QXI31069.1 CerR family C-terminal domain-containing protein [Pseudomonas vanderleydeniana]
MARHKTTAEGGYQRGEETRARIIESALRLFGERGFEGASTRDIATDAGVNAPALQYYFDNKEGVYKACVEYIIDRVWEQLAVPIEQAEQVLNEPECADQHLIDTYLTLLGGFITFIHDSPRGRDWRLFMAREQAGFGPPGTQELMDERLHRRIGGVTTGLIGRITGLPAGDERTVIRTISINSQALVFRVLRRQVLAGLGWQSIDRERMEKVREVLLGQTRLTLQALLQERGTGRL